MNLDIHPKAVGTLTSPPPVNPMGDTQYPSSFQSPPHFLRGPRDLKNR